MLLFKLVLVLLKNWVEELDKVIFILRVLNFILNVVKGGL